jgi:hypothetical protein
MRIAVVGSRTYPQLKLVEWFVKDLPFGVVIVSGGADGVDAAATEYAKLRGLETREHLPDLEGCKARHEYTERYYARNQKIVDDCDLLVAFTEKDSGGTWDAIKRARKAGKPLKIVKPSMLFPGDSGELDLDERLKAEDEMQPEEASPQQLSRIANKGKGPFAIKRVSLGSYALRRKCYVQSEEWAEIVTDKGTNPQRLSEKLIPDFVKFFDTNKRLGYIHAITVPPRSRRNLGKDHVMDITAKAVANQLGVEFVQLFEPWEKSSRGRHAKHGAISVLPEVSKYIGKVVWVLDDVTTTNFTLRASVQSLMAMEIHAHGLAYILMA